MFHCRAQSRGPRIWRRPFAPVLVVALIAPCAARAQTCAADLSDGNLNCMANDVSIARVTVLQIAHPCSGPGDTATVNLQLELLATAKTRYDVGLFVATDGGDAYTGTCVHTILTPVSTTPNPTSATGPFLDADGDACGDLAQGVTTFYDLPTLTVSCADINNDG
jgi:hypothetical protein